MNYGDKSFVTSAIWYNNTYDPLPYNLNADDNIRCKIWLDHAASYKWYYDIITNANAQSTLTQYVNNFNQSVFVDYIVTKLPFSSNYILSIGTSVLLDMLIDSCNPKSAKENFLDAYIGIDPNDSNGKYVCGTMATIVDYWPIVLQPKPDSERDIMGYEYDDLDCFYGLAYCRGHFEYELN